MNENDRTDDILLWTRLVLSLAQLVVALSVIGLIVAPPLTNGLNRVNYRDDERRGLDVGVTPATLP